MCLISEMRLVLLPQATGITKYTRNTLLLGLCLSWRQSFPINRKQPVQRPIVCLDDLLSPKVTARSRRSLFCVVAVVQLTVVRSSLIRRHLCYQTTVLPPGHRGAQQKHRQAHASCNPRASAKGTALLC